MASIQKRTSPIKFAHLAEKSEKGSISNLSTKVHPAGPRARGPLQLHVVDLHPAAVNTPALNASARKNLPLADAIRVLEAEAQQLFAALGRGYVGSNLSI